MAHQLDDEELNFFEEDTFYQESIRKLEKELAKGKTLEQACKVLSDVEQALKPVIVDDFLKILIAEYHFGRGRGIDDIALLLGLPYEKVEACRSAMMMELNQSFATHLNLEHSRLTH